MLNLYLEDDLNIILFEIIISLTVIFISFIYHCSTLVIIMLYENTRTSRFDYIYQSLSAIYIVFSILGFIISFSFYPNYQLLILTLLYNFVNFTICICYKQYFYYHRTSTRISPIISQLPNETQNTDDLLNLVHGEPINIAMTTIRGSDIETLMSPEVIPMANPV
jgi:hypothetical protein